MRTAFILFSFCFRLSLPCSIRFQFRQWSNDNSTAQCLNNQLHSNQRCCEDRPSWKWATSSAISCQPKRTFSLSSTMSRHVFFPSTSCYIPDRCDTLRCLTDLLSRSHVTLLTTLPRSCSPKRAWLTPTYVSIFPRIASRSRRAVTFSEGGHG